MDRTDIAVAGRLEWLPFGSFRQFQDYSGWPRGGRGLLIGLKLQPELAVPDAVAALRLAGLLTVPAGDNVVRLLPPLILSEAEADEGVALLDGALASLGK